MKREQLKRAAFTVILLLVAACGRPALRIDFEKYTLDNGLDVILHEDRSDPIVSVAIVYHVGSNREEPGRTGFAHLFEHILFQESENVGQDQFFKYIQGAGGTLNGFTFEDGTVYFEIVPKNALEMVLWMESDRMGYLLSTVTQEAFENQQDVVQNEKRYRVDNRPYGHTDFVIGKALYPEDHPYNWQVIGSFEDLRAASLEDVKNFFLKWYGPHNATLVIAGDFDATQTKAWVEKYFGEIRSSGTVSDPAPRPVQFVETRRYFHEDNFAQSPELNMVFPTVEGYTSDSYALEMLAELLATGKRAPLYQVIVEDEKLAPSASAGQNGMEIAGSFNFRVRAFPEADLTTVEAAIFKALDRFEEEGFTDRDLERIKTKTETAFYNAISSIFSKALQLGLYNEYNGTPGFLAQDLQNYLDVTREDVLRVYEQYIKDRPYVLTSFVPRGRSDLVAENSERFPIEEESLIAASPTRGSESTPAEFEAPANPSSFDRSVMPSFGPDPDLKLPEIWHAELENGIPVAGIVHDELPLVRFAITLRGGQLLDATDQVGVANLVSDLLMEGTRNRTPRELEEAIDDLGASIVVLTGRETMTVQAGCLASKFEATFDLALEILLEPRWDQQEFDRLKAQNLEAIHRSKANPATIAVNTFNRLLYGEAHISSIPILGTTNSVEGITIDDLKDYYKRSFSASVAHVAVVGAVTRSQALAAFQGLEADWPAGEVAFPELPATPAIEQARLYFVDVPGAKQSQLRIGNLSLAYTDPDYYPAYVMNYKLGGSFSSTLNLILREEKGYTYGARSGFSGTANPGPFVASAAVQSRTTFESLTIFREELASYSEGVSDENITFTRNALVKSNARAFETLGALRGMIGRILLYDLPD
ncbi:MAG: insulinase family protein, partial [Candidatus Marinimicrobia bacterium]|nr:insulinase family protein [Candidatus Neomarinimicrobiota bacterium]